MRSESRRHARRCGRLGVALASGLLLLGCSSEMKARAYAGDDRDTWQQPERVIAELAIQPGSRVADLGSGGGYFSFRLAAAVGPTGVVYACDVDEGMNERLEGLAKEQGSDNLVVVRAAFDDPNLPEPVDLIFTSNTYHHIEDRTAYFANAAKSLRPGGRLAVLEYRPEGFMSGLLGHGTDGDEIREELEAAGYRLAADHDFLERQSFLVFVKPE